MMKIKIITLLILCAFLLNLGCGKDDEPMAQKIDFEQSDSKEHDPKDDGDGTMIRPNIQMMESTGRIVMGIV